MFEKLLCPSRSLCQHAWQDRVSQSNTPELQDQDQDQDRDQDRFFGLRPLSLRPPPFRLAESVSWCWSWEKEKRAVVVVPGISFVHWTFSMCTATRTSSYSPVGPSVFFCVFSLGIVYSFVFLWCVCVSPSFYVALGSWVISLTVFGVSVTNLNEPPIALAASTIAWVRIFLFGPL